MKAKRAVVLAVLLTLLAGCNFPAQEPRAAATEWAPATLSPLPSLTDAASATGSPAPAVGPNEPERPEEAILILEPGSGSSLTSPIHVAGIADPSFEQTLVVRVVFVDGSELVIQPVTIAADIGQRGPFEVDIPFTVSGTRQAFIQVYDLSARDGGVVHLASVGVTLTDAGPADIKAVEPHLEQIAIFQPVFGEVIEGGVVHVEGFGLGGFEQTLLIEVYDAGGNIVGSLPIIVNAPDLGLPGIFSGDVPYEAAVAGPGRIVVRDISPAFGGDSHLSSVEVTLEP